MSAELRELYHEVIINHSKHPRNFRTLGAEARTAEGYNPLCGDQVTVSVDLVDGVLCDVAFQGTGCAVCTASASLMTETVKGKSPTDIAEISDAFRHLVTTGSPDAAGSDLGPLAAFAGVSQFPSRIKCALLPWRTLHAALQQDAATVSTE